MSVNIVKPKGWRQKYIDETCHLGRQTIAYKSIREIYHISSYCAATQTYWLWKIGFFDSCGMDTVDTKGFIDKAIRRGAIRHEDLKQLKRGDIVASSDANHNLIPDHVFEFLGWIIGKPGWGWVLDNHQPHKYQRNIIGGTTYTPASYFIRLPD